jgi:secreted trypsin-like serine protease
MALANRLRLLAAGVAVLAVLLAASPAAAVLNGQADGMAHRNVGMVGAVLPGNRVVPVCSGFLVSRTVALTAAHCVQAIHDLGTSTAIISFSPDLRVTLSPLRTGTIVMDAGYDGDGFDRHDFGAIRWTSPLTSIPPVSLPTLRLLNDLRADGQLRDQPFVAVGYGATERVHESDMAADEPGDDGTQGPWEFFADLKRNRAVSSYNALTPSALRLSTNATRADGGACYGDSGGPMFLGSTGRAVALIMSGDHICRALATTLRLDTPAARTFLTSLGVSIP